MKNAAEHAQKLFEMQVSKNDGRGVTCVRTLCVFLERGQTLEARNTATIEQDKIRGIYPDIDAYLLEHGIYEDWLVKMRGDYDEEDWHDFVEGNEGE